MRAPRYVTLPGQGRITVDQLPPEPATYLYETSTGPVELPKAQAFTMTACLQALDHAGIAPTWHRNECGCCVSVHAAVEHPTEGWVISRDGGADWLEHHHEEEER